MSFSEIAGRLEAEREALLSQRAMQMFMALGKTQAGVTADDDATVQATVSVYTEACKKIEQLETLHDRAYRQIGIVDDLERESMSFGIGRGDLVGTKGPARPTIRAREIVRDSGSGSTKVVVPGVSGVAGVAGVAGASISYKDAPFPYRHNDMPPFGEMMQQLVKERQSRANMRSGELAYPCPNEFIFTKDDVLRLALVMRAYPTQSTNIDGLTDHYVEVLRMQCRELGQLSPIEAWNTIRATLTNAGVVEDLSVTAPKKAPVPASTLAELRTVVNAIPKARAAPTATAATAAVVGVLPTAEPTWDWTDANKSPHTAQVALNPGAGYASRTDLPLKRILSADDPRATYRSRKGEEKTVIHWGQRKLLFSEIEFLTLYAKPGFTVVYAGAAPGTHMEYLSKLFPDIYFILIDPAPFTVRGTSRIICLNMYFDDTVAAQFAAKFAGKGILFISDIRTVNWENHDSQEVERKVWDDMLAQQRWYDIMKPEAAMLKFRLPWVGNGGPEASEYLVGDIYLPIWGPITTTETRLIVGKDALKKIYDNKLYEEQLFYFNTVTRTSLYKHAVRGEGLDHCYDCAAEIYVLSEYLRHYPPSMTSTNSLEDHISDMSRAISGKIGSGRTLATGNVEAGQRNAIIKERQWSKPRAAVAAAPVQGSGPGGSFTNHELHEIVYAKTRGCNLFNITMGIYLLTGDKGAPHWGPVDKQGRPMTGPGAVLDPAAGWGDRLGAAAIAGATSYTAWDTNNGLQSVYRNLAGEYIAVNPGMIWSVTAAPFERAVVQQSAYDTVLTSPPFFTQELYQGSETSTTAHSTEEQWYTDYYRPMWRLAASALRPGGRVIAYIPPGKMYTEAHKTLRREGFQLVGAVGFYQYIESVVGAGTVSKTVIPGKIRDAYIWRKPLESPQIYRLRSIRAEPNVLHNMRLSPSVDKISAQMAMMVDVVMIALATGKTVDTRDKAIAALKSVSQSPPALPTLTALEYLDRNDNETYDHTYTLVAPRAKYVGLSLRPLSEWPAPRPTPAKPIAGLVVKSGDTASTGRAVAAAADVVTQTPLSPPGWHCMHDSKRELQPLDRKYETGLIALTEDKRTMQNVGNGRVWDAAKVRELYVPRGPAAGKKSSDLFDYKNFVLLLDGYVKGLVQFKTSRAHGRKADPRYYVTIFIAHGCYNQGHGKWALGQAIDAMRMLSADTASGVKAPVAFGAHISGDNVASLALHRGLGFREEAVEYINGAPYIAFGLAPPFPEVELGTYVLSLENLQIPSTVSGLASLVQQQRPGHTARAITMEEAVTRGACDYVVPHGAAAEDHRLWRIVTMMRGRLDADQITSKMLLDLRMRDVRTPSGFPVIAESIRIDTKRLDQKDIWAVRDRQADRTQQLPAEVQWHWIWRDATGYAGRDVMVGAPGTLARLETAMRGGSGAATKPQYGLLTRLETDPMVLGWRAADFRDPGFVGVPGDTARMSDPNPVVHNPELYAERMEVIEPRKFHLRVYAVIIADKYGKRFGLYRDGHLICFGDQEYQPKYGDEFVLDVKQHNTRLRGYNTKPFLSTFDEYLQRVTPPGQRAAITAADLMRQIAELFRTVAVTCMPSVRPYAESHYGYEILGCDIMVNREGRAWIVEMNKKHASFKMSDATVNSVAGNLYTGLYTYLQSPGSNAYVTEVWSETVPKIPKQNLAAIAHAANAARVARASASGTGAAAAASSRPVQDNIGAFHSALKYSELSEIKKLLGHVTGRPLKIIDLACGRGGDFGKYQTTFGKTSAYTVLGLDVDATAIDNARKRLPALKKQYSLRPDDYTLDVADLTSEETELKLAETVATRGKFDLIVCNFAVHYFFRTQETFERFVRIVKHLAGPGTVLWMMSPDGNRLRDLLKARGTPTVDGKSLVITNSVYNLSATQESLSGNGYGKMIRYRLNTVYFQTGTELDEGGFSDEPRIPLDILVESMGSEFIKRRGPMVFSNMTNVSDRARQTSKALSHEEREISYTNFNLVMQVPLQ